MTRWIITTWLKTLLPSLLLKKITLSIPSSSSLSALSSGYLKAKQYMEEENYDKIISECTKEIDSAGRYTTEALILRATFYLLIGNATAAQPDLDRVINTQDANVKVAPTLPPRQSLSQSAVLCDARAEWRIMGVLEAMGIPSVLVVIKRVCLRTTRTRLRNYHIFLRNLKIDIFMHPVASRYSENP